MVTGVSSSSSMTVYDPRDTNKDGKVSATEQMMWDFKHSNTVKESDGKSAKAMVSYDASGKASSTGTGGTVDSLF